MQCPVCKKSKLIGWGKRVCKGKDGNVAHKQRFQCQICGHIVSVPVPVPMGKRKAVKR